VTSGDPGALERRVGAALVGRRVVAPTALGPLLAEGRAQGVAVAGSFLAGAAVRRGLLRPADAEALVRAALASGSGAGPTASGAGPVPGGAAFAPTVQEPGPAPGGADVAPTVHGPGPGPGGADVAPTVHGPGPGPGGADVAPTAPGSGPIPGPPDLAPAGAEGSASAGDVDLVGELFAGDRYAPLEVVGPETVAVRARDRRLRREVEVRLGRPGEDPARFLREAGVLARLDHPAVPRVHDVGRLGGRPYYAVDRLEGERLADLDPGPADRPRLLRAFLGVCGAVEHAHDAGIVHGVLAPERVLLGSLGRAWVTGWAGALAAPDADEGARRATAAPAPTPAADALVAPERRGAGATLDPRADVWGLGAVLHFALTGRRPAKTTGARRRSEADGGDAPAELRAIARRALARRPGERYPDAGALAADVRRYLDGRAILAMRESLVGTLRRLARRHPAPAAIVGVAVLAAVGALAVVAALTIRDGLAASEDFAAADAAKAEVDAAGAAAEVELTAAGASIRQATWRLRFGETLAAAAAREPAAEPFDPAVTLLASADAPPGGSAERAAAEDDLRRARARYYLHTAPAFVDADGSPADADRVDRVGRYVGRALADLRDLAAPRPADALERLRAARRLPGLAARAEEERALAALTEGPDEALADLADLARAVAAIEALEAAGELEAAIARARERADAAAALVERRPASALARELHGRVLLSAAGRFRDKTQIADDGVANVRYLDGLERMIESAVIDPLDPLARARIAEQWQAKFHLHAIDRWMASWYFGHLYRATHRAPRIEPLLELVHDMQVLRRQDVGLRLAEEAWRRIELTAEPDPEVRAEALLLLVRGQLHTGAEPRPGLDEVALPDRLEADRRLLLGWIDLLAGRTDPGLRAIGAVVAGHAGAPTPAARHDVLAALADPRVRDPARSLRPDWVPGGRPAHFHAQVLRAHLRIGCRLGRDVGQIVDVLRRRGGRECFAEVYLATASQLGRADPADPTSHAVALLAWSRVGLGIYHEGEQAAWARRLVVDRLESRGRSAAAGRFAELAPLADVVPRKAWIPEVIWGGERP